MPLSSAAVAFGVRLIVPVAWARATEKHSGAGGSADKTQITIEEMGPWHGPNTQPIRRTFKWNDSTRIVVAERTWDGEGGWRWAFNDQAAPPSGLRTGDFVTVTTEPRGARAVAVEVLVVWPGTHLEIPGSS